MASVSSKRRQKFARRTQPSQSKGLSAAVMSASESKVVAEEVSQGLEGVTAAIDVQSNLQTKIAEQQLTVFKQLLKATAENKPSLAENKAITNKSAGITGKIMSGGFGAAVQTAKDVAAQKITDVKKLLTPEGLAQAAAGAAGGGLTSTILGGVAEHFRAKRESGASEKDWKESFLTGTERGRALVAEHGMEGAEKHAARAYEEHKTLTEGVQTLEAKQRKIKSSGIVGADLGEADLAELAAKKQKLAGIGQASREEYVNPIAKAVAGAAGAELSKQGGALAGNEQFLSGIEAGAAEELQKVSVEQLAVLKKILASTEKTEEERIEEASAEKKNQVNGPSAKENTAEKQEEKKGLMSSIMDSAKGLIGGKLAGKAMSAGKTLLSGAARFARFASPAGAVAGAGYAGYKAGGLLNDYIINPLAGAITGNKDETLGSALYSGVQRTKGFFGMETDASAQAAAEAAGRQQAQAALAKRKAAKFIIPPEDAAKSAAANAKAAVEYQTAAPEEQAKIREVVGGTEEELNAAFAKLLKNKPIDADTEKLLVKNGYEVPDYLKVPPAPTAANQPLRNMQTAALEQSTATVNDAKLQPPIAAEMAKTVNSTNVINNNTNTTVIRPDVRTAEPSFNRVLSHNFSF